VKSKISKNANSRCKPSVPDVRKANKEGKQELVKTSPEPKVVNVESEHAKLPYLLKSAPKLNPEVKKPEVLEKKKSIFQKFCAWIGGN